MQGEIRNRLNAKPWGPGLLAVAAISVAITGCDSTEGATSADGNAQNQWGGGGWQSGTGGFQSGAGGLLTGTGGAANPDLTGTGGATVPGNDTPAVGDSAWCQTLGVLRTSCQGCHAAELAYGAPMPLVSYEDTQAPSPFDGSVKVHQRIAARIHDPVSPMPPTSQPPLTPEQKGLIDAWIAGGAMPGNDPTCEGADIVDAPIPDEEMEYEWPEDCEERYEFRASDGLGGPHVVAAGAETHPNFTFDVPWSGEVQAVAIRPISDNKRILHHWILYQGNSFLTGWAPGGEGDIPPDDVGTYMPSSGTLTLDVHYYNVGNPQAEMDRSGVEICITRNLRPHTAATFPFTAPATAPAGQRTESVNTCRVNADQPVYLIGSSPHMHQLGVHAKLEVIRQNGTVEVLHDRPFSFEDQLAVEIGPVQLNDGDRVRTTCVYENPTAQTVQFGTGSDDEMCFNFAKFYPMCGMTCTGGDTISKVISDSQGGGCPTGGGGGGWGGGLGGLFGN